MSLLLDLTLDIPLPPGPNGRNGLLRMHWAKMKAIKAQLKETLEEALSQAESVPDNLSEPVVIEYTRYRRAGPPMDKDNAYSSTKIVTDLLVKLGVLENDVPKIVTDIVVNQEQDYFKPTRLGIKIWSEVPEA